MANSLAMSTPYDVLDFPGSPLETKTVLRGGHELKIWVNAPDTLRDVLLLGREWPDQELFVAGEARWTYAEHLNAATRFANVLRGPLGLSKGDRVAIAMRNMPEWSVAYWGSILAGCVAVPINAWMLGAEIDYCLTDSEAKVLVADSERLERFEPYAAASTIAHRVAVDGSLRAGEVSLTSLLNAVGDEFPEVDIRSEDAATIFYTSGTTGKPKGALGTHFAACQNILCNAVLGANSHIERTGSLDGFTVKHPGRSTLLTIPLFHVGGCNGSLVYAMFTGGRLIFMDRWDTAQAMNLIKRYDVEQLFGVPAQFVQVAEMLEQLPHDEVPSSIDYMVMGAAPPPVGLFERLQTLFPNAVLVVGYGQTECTQVVCGSVGKNFKAYPKSCGHPLPVVQVAIRIDGAIIAPSELGDRAGELMIRAPHVAQEYINRPEATEETFANGWLATGDIVTINPEGFISIVDRAKDMVLRGGENIYSIEVEQALYSYPGVVEAAVYGRSHPVLGEEPVATVYLVPGCSVSDQELREHVRGRLAHFKVPAEVFFVDEPLQRNANGKILKAPLRAKVENDRPST